MACKTLNVVDEVFGPSVSPSVVDGTLKRGEWLGLTLASNINGAWVPVPSQTYDVVDTPVTVTRDPSNQTVTASVGGVQVTLPWRALTAGDTNLLVAKFRTGADFLVIRDVDGTDPTTAQWRFWVFDVRTAIAPQPVVLGPFAVVAGNNLNFCPNGNGQLVLLWHAAQPPGNVIGRRAWVQRTEVDAASIPAFAAVDDLGAQGTLGAEVTAAGRAVTVFDNAYRNGNVSVARTANSRNLGSATLPTPGKLSLSPQSLTMGANEDSRSFTVNNVGGDFLSLDSLAVDMPAAIGLKQLVPGTCILPNQVIAVEVDRLSMAAASVTVSVGVTPVAAPPASGKLVVDMRAKPVAPPRPALSVQPAALSWRVSQADARTVSLKNSGNVAVDVRVAAAATGGGFGWTALALTTLQPNQMNATQVTPQPGGPDQGAMTVEAFLAGTTTALAGFTLSVALTKNVVAKVPLGSLRITALLADAPGDDMAPEGEFIEIANVTAAPLDLTGCAVTHEVRSGTSNSHPQRRLVMFGSTAFGSNAMLPPLTVAGRPLRVLTRAKTGGVPSDPLRYYCDNRAAVWNNSGDTARVLNEFGEEVATYSYVTQYASTGTAPPAGTVVILPPAKRRIATRRVFVDARNDWTTTFSVQEGDVLRVRDVTGRVTLGGFFGNAGDSGPEGRAGESAPDTFPVPGAPLYALVGCLGKRESDGTVTQVGLPFFVGTGAVVTVAVSDAALGLFLGVNDDSLWDNGGMFDAAVDLSR